MVAAAPEFTSHYDASGSVSDQSGVLLIAGLVATVYSWSKFEVDWRAALRRRPTAPYLHMRDFVARKGPYEGWSDDNRRLFLTRLVDIIEHRLTTIFLAGIFLEDYARVNHEYTLDEACNGAYALTAGTCMRSVQNWRDQTRPGTKLLHVVERGDNRQGGLWKVLQKESDLDAMPKTKVDETGEWFAPFQACDLAAWEYRRAYVKRASLPDDAAFFAEMRQPFKRLHRFFQPQNEVFQEQELRLLCEDARGRQLAIENRGKGDTA